MPSCCCNGMNPDCCLCGGTGSSMPLALLSSAKRREAPKPGPTPTVLPKLRRSVQSECDLKAQYPSPPRVRPKVPSREETKVRDLQPCRLCATPVSSARMRLHIAERCPKNPNRVTLKAQKTGKKSAKTLRNKRRKEEARRKLQDNNSSQTSIPAGDRWEWDMTTPNTPFWRR
jgi:hypothetical protein